MSKKYWIFRILPLFLLFQFMMLIPFHGLASAGNYNEQIILPSQFNPIDSSITHLDNIKLNEFDTSIPYVDVSSSNVNIDGLITANEYPRSYYAPTKQDDTIGIYAYWEHNDENLTIALVAPGDGWVGIGFGTGMADSNMIIGGNNGSAYCVDLIGTGAISHDEDAEQNILEFSSTENSTHTILEFIIYLNSGDSDDVVLTEGEVYSVFLAYRVAGDYVDSSFGSIHSGYSEYFNVMIEPEGYIPPADLDVGAFDVSLPFNAVSNITIDGQIDSNEYAGSMSDISSGLTVYWEHSAENISFGLVSPGTGWVALGIGAKFQQYGANIIMGGVRDGTPYIEDLVGLSDYALPHDTDERHGGDNNILDFDAFENETMTILEFVIPLNSTDTLDLALEEGKIYQMFLGYHALSDDLTKPHTAHSDYIDVFLRPFVNEIETSMLLDLPETVHYYENFTFSITILDDNKNPIEDMPIQFFIVTQFGDYEIGTDITNSSGIANITYFNPYLANMRTLGAKSKEVIFFEQGDIFAYKSNTVKQDIEFIPAEEEEEEAYVQLSRVAIVIAFWVAGVVIWGSFSISLWGIVTIYQDRNSVEENENDIGGDVK